MSIEINLGKNAFKKFTKSALVEMLEDAVMAEHKRSLPSHKRGEAAEYDKDEEDEEADEEREKTADLVEETRGKPNPVEMSDEDMSDAAMDKIKQRAKSTSKKTKDA